MSKKYVGTHLSYSKANPLATVEAMTNVGAEAAAIFMNGAHTTNTSLLKPAIARSFRNKLKTILPCNDLLLPHAGFPINLASHKGNIFHNSKTVFKSELASAEQFGCGVVFHPGSAVDKNKPRGIAQIADALNDMLPLYEATAIIETMGGKKDGNVIGSSFEEIAGIINRIHDKEKIGVCIDTCHMFIGGYDIREEKKFDAIMRDFDRIIGLKYLCGIHLNDSKYDLGSGRDVHMAIGKGKIGESAFKFLMNDPRFDNMPIITETHLGIPSAIKAELAYVRGLARKA